MATMSSTLAPRDRSAKRTREALQDRPDRPRAAQILAHLVGDVAGVEVGEHQHVGSSCDRDRLPSLFFAATAGTNAASACISPSIASSGARARAMTSARTHLVHMGVRRAAFGREGQQRDARLPRATRCGNSRLTRGAMSASASGVGSAFTAQSAKISVCSANSIRKKLDGVAQTGASPIVIIPASITRAVVPRGAGDHRVGIARFPPSGPRGTGVCPRGGARSSDSRPDAPSRWPAADASSAGARSARLPAGSA